MVLPLCGERERFCVLMNFAEVLSIAHWLSMKRQNMSGGASFTHKIYLTDGAHPGLHRPVYLLLMGNVSLRIRKSFGAAGKGAIFHLKEKPPYFIARARARTINMSGAAFLSHQLPTTKKKPTICWTGIEMEMVAKKIKKKDIKGNNKYTISVGLYQFY